MVFRRKDNCTGVRLLHKDGYEMARSGREPLYIAETLAMLEGENDAISSLSPLSMISWLCDNTVSVLIAQRKFGQETLSHRPPDKTFNSASRQKFCLRPSENTSLIASLARRLEVPSLLPD